LQEQQNIIDDVKGKSPLNVFAGKQKHKVPLEKQTPKHLWQPPEEGWIKINADGSSVETTGEASVGVIIRDHEGHVLLSSWRYMFQCSSAEEAELLVSLISRARWAFSPRALIGAPQLVPSWWVPVPLRYKRIGRGQRHGI
jgi:hypothetical protein